MAGKRCSTTIFDKITWFDPGGIGGNSPAFHRWVSNQ
jgi:hypothetical protein